MEKELLLHWMAESQMLEKANVRLNDVATRVSEWFRKKGFRTCILKGQGNALMYPNGLHRTPGDIDIWVEGGDKRVISFVRYISPHEKACYHHIEFPLTHIYAHLMNEGIGLRQLLDYYYVLISDDLLLIRDRVQKELKELGLWKFAGAIMYIMQEVFGMPASRLIVPPNEKYGRFVLNEVLEAGNFGKHDARNRFGRSQLGHNLQRVYRDIRLVKYFPAEAMSEPFFRVWHFFWRVKNKK